MYALSFETVNLVILTGIFLWIIIRIIISKSNGWRTVMHCWKVINFICTVISLYGVLSYTVLNRTPSSTHEFTFFAEYGPEFYREMIMNAFLYFPFGLTLSTLIGPFSVLLGLIISLSVETWQYLAGTGLAQGTDVIMNTLGVAIGCVPWLIVKALEKRRKEPKQ